MEGRLVNDWSDQHGRTIVSALYRRAAKPV